MRTATGLALIAIGAILAFAVTTSPPFFNLQVAGWILILTGLAGMFVPRRGYGWLRRRAGVRGAPLGGGLGGGGGGGSGGRRSRAGGGGRRRGPGGKAPRPRAACPRPCPGPPPSGPSPAPAPPPRRRSRSTSRNNGPGSPGVAVQAGVG